MTSKCTESLVEEAALSWFDELGYTILAGPEIAPGELLAERHAFNDANSHEATGSCALLTQQAHTKRSNRRSAS